ncbi:unnamed protein product [Wuchereria bancrofti]|uniref:Uncharacterized protein n=1 Tax=Wuchereria bancrofti TaxID=6293 RepID=A0A3P7E2S4_WUCBA|nr:unnamed protein product [Wuchereria bancrofti]
MVVLRIHKLLELESCFRIMYFIRYVSRQSNTSISGQTATVIIFAAAESEEEVLSAQHVLVEPDKTGRLTHGCVMQQPSSTELFPGGLKFEKVADSAGKFSCWSNSSSDGISGEIFMNML